MNKVVSIEEFMVNKVSKLINKDYRPSEIATMLNKPIEHVHMWMSKRN